MPISDSMAKTKKKPSAAKIAVEIVIFIALLALAAGLMFFRVGINTPDPAEGAPRLTAALSEAAKGRIPGGTGDAALISDAAERAFELKLAGVEKLSSRKAALNLELRVVDWAASLAALEENFDTALYNRVDAAKSAAEVFDESGSYNEATLNSAFQEALSACLTEPVYTTTLYSAPLKYSKDAWQLEDDANIQGVLAALALPENQPDDECAKLFSACKDGATLYELRFRIDENALSAPAPDPEKFGSTNDPAVVQALLETDEAKKLIGDETLVWNAGIERIPGTEIHYYLDETILTIVWQEVANRGVGTFSEVFVADGSQLRRKIDGDEFGSMEFRTTSQFAEETNAVLALGGDFYNHDRACGIVVYQRQIYRFEPETCDTCFITADGDMLFAYRGQFTSLEEAQAFVDENDVLFSLCFGPVLIDDGQDVTPESYRWGEIKDDFARSALGMFGRGHYMTVNMNCQQPGYYYLSTLRACADEMIKRGCQKAYTLDGGQTATTVFNYQLINPVQFGWEKTISDIIYFGTALPEA